MLRLFQGRWSREYEQKADKAGLFVKEELDKAIERCKEKVQNIAEECRSQNQRFRDIEFDLEEDRDRCLNGLAPSDGDDLSPGDVMRLYQIFDKPEFFIDGASSGDISQGALGDCWFLSAVATVATVPKLIDRICVARDEQVGVYGFVFHNESGWTDVIIDDLLFTNYTRLEDLETAELDKRPDKRGRRALYFASSLTENETWVPLFEKAYAKLFGDYKALAGGYCSCAIEDMTGGVSTTMQMADILDPDRLWNDQLTRANRDMLFSCYIMQNKAGSRDFVKGIRTSKRFVKVRNPWGEREWSGKWSDGSKEWTKEWLMALDDLNHKFGDDGEFLMEYPEFLTTFTRLDKTRLFDSSWVLSSQWLEVYAPAWKFGDVSFTVKVDGKTPSIFVLSQLETRYYQGLEGPYGWTFDFVVYPKSAMKPIARSRHNMLWDRSVVAEIDLEAGDYVVHVRLDRSRLRADNWFFENISKWDERKRVRKLTQQAISQSIASNFDPSPWTDYLPPPNESFGGEDLTELEMNAFAAAVQGRQLTKAVSTSVIERSSLVDQVLHAEIKAATSQPESEEHASSKKADNADSSDTDSTESNDGSDEERKPDTMDDKKEAKTEAKEDRKTETLIVDGISDVLTQPPPLIVDPGAICDICKMSPIVGPLYKCLDAECTNFDMCQQCYGSGKHDPSHRVLRLDTSEDAQKAALTYDDQIDPNDKIVLGLKVYTKRDFPANIKGQLRHGTVLKWTKNGKAVKPTAGSTTQA
ncbi:cysteine proteinase [Punctularia strigosozonata HHB-11173 SS5]|uniref:cysteine proteinase n=1 Tax=Punctularia strigosozonata (strain HHB-11173) TaxID=741275 RepID=UPI0004416D67|nr:cysteine proteinase [Punctularia strigosozonata HHB-11173 SS5]EIN09345.1 cysteine proteinase [Punctularia strigosozonata HHB-11173 SS5]